MDDKKLVITENLLPQTILERQLEIIKNTCWVLGYTTYDHLPENIENTNIKQQYGFSRVIQFNETWESEWYWTINLLICEKFPQLKGLELARVRLALLTQNENQIVNTPHVDFKEPSYTGLLYLNDIDGDTHFYEERYVSDKNENELFEKMNFTVDKKITPKANKFVLFDGDIYHSSCNPTEDYARFVINFNWIKR